MKQHHSLPLLVLLCLSSCTTNASVSESLPLKFIDFQDHYEVMANEDYDYRKGIPEEVTIPFTYQNKPVELPDLSDSESGRFGALHTKHLILAEGFSELPINCFSGMMAKFNDAAYSFSLSLPSTLITIDKQALAECMASSIDFPQGCHLSTIGIAAFENSPISDFVFPSSLTEVGNRAFSMSSLQHVFIPSTVTEMGFSVFEYCKNLDLLHVEASSKPTLWNEDWNAWTANHDFYDVEWSSSITSTTHSRICKPLSVEKAPGEAFESYVFDHFSKTVGDKEMGIATCYSQNFALSQVPLTTDLGTATNYDFRIDFFGMSDIIFILETDFCEVALSFSFGDFVASLTSDSAPFYANYHNYPSLGAMAKCTENGFSRTVYYTFSQFKFTSDAYVSSLMLSRRWGALSTQSLKDQCDNTVMSCINYDIALLSGFLQSANLKPLTYDCRHPS